MDKGPAETLRHHWPEYLMEAAELGLFMVTAGVFARRAKLHHHTTRRCIFRCGYGKSRQPTEALP